MRLRTAVLLFCCAGMLPSARPASRVQDADTDRDGLSDALEQEMLERFEPRFMLNKSDCAHKPAYFAPGSPDPYVLREDGTIYGQAFPRKNASGEVELHYYHLWSRDCGELGHALDTEHVSVLLRGDGAGTWKAASWYASAHEDTPCDASHLARASTLDAETKGPTVWISSGKHASFLDERLCRSGCGGDRCVGQEKLRPAAVINLGEPGRPMNGAVWTGSSEWLLASKMKRTDFSAVRAARLAHLPELSIAWANPAKRPQQAVIFGGNAAIGGMVLSGKNTDAALADANGKTGDALTKASGNTSRALTHGFRAVGKALGRAAKQTTSSAGIEHD